MPSPSSRPFSARPQALWPPALSSFPRRVMALVSSRPYIRIPATHRTPFPGHRSHDRHVTRFVKRQGKSGGLLPFPAKSVPLLFDGVHPPAHQTLKHNTVFALYDFAPLSTGLAADIMSICSAAASYPSFLPVPTPPMGLIEDYASSAHTRHPLDSNTRTTQGTFSWKATEPQGAGPKDWLYHFYLLPFV